MHNDADAHDLQMFDACLTPECYTTNEMHRTTLKHESG
jgi:hypothetical protein